MDTDKTGKYADFVVRSIFAAMDSKPKTLNTILSETLGAGADCLKEDQIRTWQEMLLLLSKWGFIVCERKRREAWRLPDRISGYFDEADPSRTLFDWLSMLPDELRKRAYSNSALSWLSYSNFFREQKCCSGVEALEFAFVWGCTPEGWPFWKSVADNFTNICSDASTYLLLLPVQEAQEKCA